MKKWIWTHRRGILWFWICLGTCAVTAVEVLSIRQTGKILVLPFLFLFMWYWVGTSSVSYGNIRRNREANEQLNKFCDPEPMLRWTEEELDHYVRSGQARKRRNIVDVLAIDQAVALSALGRYEQAVTAQQRMDPEIASFQLRVIYYANAAAFFTSLGQFSAAETALEKAQDFLARNKKPTPFVQDALILNWMELAIAKGETRGVEQELLPLLDRATTEYARVARHHALAELYLKEKRFSKARAHLEYVAAHGNKLYIRTEAEELLRTLPEKEKAVADPTYQSKYDQ